MYHDGALRAVRFYSRETFALLNEQTALQDWVDQMDVVSLAVYSVNPRLKVEEASLYRYVSP